MEGEKKKEERGRKREEGRRKEKGRKGKGKTMKEEGRMKFGGHFGSRGGPGIYFGGILGVRGCILEQFGRSGHHFDCLGAALESPGATLGR